ncbi:glucose-6-phosphate isomerase [Kordiimonas sediminis]|uniref:Glucose-6-phosphate isomerase n=1 Tax=Kordiimonas sediminis TaxID=1735581 RepID=A0A919AXH4_9PROT|nr:glucose-6-phosphate isomerase [Kordiimonas sediminis]GHF31136.1 glucose-6-phosphate isomerase [Kordiimonas sediminis]
MSSNLKEAWLRLRALSKGVDSLVLKDMFAKEPNRFEKYSLSHDGLLFDFSKNRIDETSIDSLLGLAKASDLDEARRAMFRGDTINFTEGRAARHVALRSDEPSDVSEDVLRNRQQMLDFAEEVRAGNVCGSTGKAYTDVVNIGIGGSDLGPEMVTIALSPHHSGPRCHFVSNIDGSHIADTLLGLDPETTLFLVVSKSFTTLETMTNARAAMKWLTASLGDSAVRDHFVAISTNLPKVQEFGIDETRIFGFQEWVGGRYSVWSSVGLSVAIALGADNFKAFLAGAHSMDKHFLEADFRDNIPVMLALMGVWNRDVLGFLSTAIFPYDQRMRRFAAYMQQLDMESNGKRITRDGSVVEMDTGPLIWGQPGSNGQHAFFQWLHQGTNCVPADFLIAAKPTNADEGQHASLLANCLAQTEALAVGRTYDETVSKLKAEGRDEATIQRLAPHQVFPGNKPSNTILFPQLTPYYLGMLIALYEHKVYVQGVLWQINSFDQYGVELGKELALATEAQMHNGQPGAESPYTAGIMAAVKALRK